MIGIIVTFFAAGQTFNIVGINERRAAASRAATRSGWSARAACSSASSARAVSSRSTPGSPTPWPARPRSPRSSTPRRWSSPACTSAPASTACSGRASRSRRGGINPMALIGGDHDPHRRRARVRAGRHQEGPRVLDDQPARVHGHGPRRRRLGRRGVPPLHPRVLQGPALPRRRLGQPLGLAPLLRHEEGHGWAAQVHADHLRDVHDRLARARRRLPARRASGPRTRSSPPRARAASRSSWWSA